MNGVLSHRCGFLCREMVQRSQHPWCMADLVLGNEAGLQLLQVLPVNEFQDVFHQGYLQR